MSWLLPGLLQREEMGGNASSFLVQEEEFLEGKLGGRTTTPDYTLDPKHDGGKDERGSSVLFKEGVRRRI